MTYKYIIYFLLFIGSNLYAQTDSSENIYSIIQNAETNIVCNSANNATCSEKRVITILNEKGRSEANFACYCDKYNSLQSFHGEIRDANGNTIKKIKRGDIQMSEYSEELGSDAYFYYYEYIPARYPITIVYEWETKYKDGLIGFPSFIPQKSYNQKVIQASYKIQTLGDNPCRYKQVNIQTNLDQHKTSEGNWITEVHVSSLPPIKEEPFAPELAELIPRIYFAPTNFTFENTQGCLNSWKTYGQWQNQLLQERDLLPEELKQNLQQRTANLKTPYEKIVAVYEYLGTNTRYVSIQLGLGGLQPTKAFDVYKTGFSDCKGLSNYAKAMLAVLGIPSFYTVISTEKKHLLSDFASANQMNHVILQVPLEKDTIWMECTNPKLPLGYIHYGIAGHDALQITQEGGFIKQLPTYPDSVNKQANNAIVVLNPEGDATINIKRSSYLFQYESDTPLLYVEPSKQKDMLRETINLPQAQLSNIDIREIKERKPVIQCLYGIQSGQYGNKTGKRLFIPANIFHKEFHIPDSQSQRTQKIEMDYGYLDVDTINIQIPNGYEIEALPQNIEIKEKYGVFKGIVQLKDQTISIIQQLLFYHGSYPKEDYPDFINFRKKVSTQYNTKIILKRTDNNNA